MDTLQDAHAAMDRRNGTPQGAVPRWKKIARSAAQVIAAGALLGSGVVFTVQQQHPEFKQPAAGLKVAGALIEAPSVSEEASRIAAVLKQYTKDPLAANRIAGAIVDESSRRNIDPALMVGVLLTEDATLDTTARSIVGARGLMQVMPLHAGKWGCGSSNLLSIETNICHGASILQDNIRNSSSTRAALLKYNGCIPGKSNATCHTYPDKVLRAANRAAGQMLAMAE